MHNLVFGCGDFSFTIVNDGCRFTKSGFVNFTQVYVVITLMIKYIFRAKMTIRQKQIDLLRDVLLTLFLANFLKQAS